MVVYLVQQIFTTGSGPAKVSCATLGWNADCKSMIGKIYAIITTCTLCGFTRKRDEGYKGTYGGVPV